MIFVPKLNIWNPLPRKFQRGYLTLAAVTMLGGADRVEFSFAGVTIQSVGVGDQQARVVFKRNGNIDKFTTQGGTVNIGTWWTGAPETTIGDLYEVGYTNLLLGTFNDVEAAVEDAFIQISSIRQWGVIDTAPPGPFIEARGTFRISLLGEGIPIDSALITCRADEEI